MAQFDAPTDQTGDNKRITAMKEHSLIVENYRFLWFIKNVRNRLANQDSLHTPFGIGKRAISRWNAKLQQKPDDPNQISLYVVLSGTHNSEFRIQAKCSFGILKDDGKRIGFASRPVNYKKSAGFEVFHRNHRRSANFENFVRLDELANPANRYLTSDGSIWICIDMGLLDASAQIMLQDHPIVDSLKHNLADLMLQPNRFQDITFVIGETSIKAHKAVLGCRSEVFRAMFDHDENKETIKIEDVSADVFKCLLQFVYGGVVHVSKEEASRLLVAADKYDLPQLKDICQEVMWRNLTLESACESLILADRHNAEELKQKAMEFIKCNVESFLETDDWQALLENSKLHHFVTELMKVELPWPWSLFKRVRKE